MSRLLTNLRVDILVSLMAIWLIYNSLRHSRHRCIPAAASDMWRAVARFWLSKASEKTRFRHQNGGLRAQFFLDISLPLLTSSA